MRTEILKNWSEQYALKRRIALLLKSPRVALWRICGKDVQKYFLYAYRKQEVNLKKTIEDIVGLYERDIVEKMVFMSNKERRAKLSNLHRYAEGKF